MGIEVRMGYEPQRTEEAEQSFRQGPWSQEPPAPSRPGECIRYMGRILQLLEGTQATRIWSRRPKLAQTKILGAGGPKTGMTWTAAPDASTKGLPDAHWRCITRERLGMLRVRPGATCGLPRSQRKGGGCCGKALDTHMHHIWHCRTAVARLRIHDAVGHRLARSLRAAKGNVDIERAMPDMAIRKPDGSIEEAIMDLTCWLPGMPEWHGIDVTVRYPGATRYYGAADHVGKAATKAEAEKVRRYGKGVLPLAYETGGRLGVGSMNSLRQLAAKAAAVDGGFLTAAGLENRWRRRIEAALLFAVADALLLAMGGEQASHLGTGRVRAGGRPPGSSSQVVHAICTDAPGQTTEVPFDFETELEACCEEHVFLDPAAAEGAVGHGHQLSCPPDSLAADEEVAAHLFGDSFPQGEGDATLAD